MDESKHDMNCDWYLQKLVEDVNTADSEMGIMIISGGIIISGDLISNKKYFSIILEILEDTIKDREVLESVREQYNSYKDSSKPAQYIHFNNAQFFDISGKRLPQNTIQWRGRLSEVSGFSIGKLIRETN